MNPDTAPCEECAYTESVRIYPMAEWDGTHRPTWLCPECARWHGFLPLEDPASDHSRMVETEAKILAGTRYGRRQGWAWHVSVVASAERVMWSLARRGLTGSPEYLAARVLRAEAFLSYLER